MGPFLGSMRSFRQSACPLRSGQASWARFLSAAVDTAPGPGTGQAHTDQEPYGGSWTEARTCVGPRPTLDRGQVDRAEGPHGCERLPRRKRQCKRPPGRRRASTTANRSPRGGSPTSPAPCAGPSPGPWTRTSSRSVGAMRRRGGHCLRSSTRSRRCGPAAGSNAGRFACPSPATAVPWGRRPGEVRASRSPDVAHLKAEAPTAAGSSFPMSEEGDVRDLSSAHEDGARARRSDGSVPTEAPGNGSRCSKQLRTGVAKLGEGRAEGRSPAPSCTSRSRPVRA